MSTVKNIRVGRMARGYIRVHS